MVSRSSSPREPCRTMNGSALRQAQDERMRARCPRSKLGCIQIWDRYCGLDTVPN